jgi:hypothetical protein
MSCDSNRLMMPLRKPKEFLEGKMNPDRNMLMSAIYLIMCLAVGRDE